MAHVLPSAYMVANLFLHLISNHQQDNYEKIWLMQMNERLIKASQGRGLGNHDLTMPWHVASRLPSFTSYFSTVTKSSCKVLRIKKCGTSGHNTVQPAIHDLGMK